MARFNLCLIIRFITGIEQLLFDMPIYTSEIGCVRFRDIYVDLVIIDGVDKVITHDVSAQLELETVLSRVDLIM